MRSTGYCPWPLHPVCGQILNTLRFFTLLCGLLVISLSSCLVSGTETLFLLVKNVLPAIRPVLSLFTNPSRLTAHSFAPFLSFRAKHLARFFSRARRIQNSNNRPYSETRQEPQKCVAVAICHS